MADVKISQLTALNGADAVAADLLTVVDISDTTMSASGTNKKMTLVQFQAAPISAGTANGVTYLNGSKVLTSGSALVFDGSNLGLGVTPSAWPGQAANYDVLQVGVSSLANIADVAAEVSYNQFIDSGGTRRYIASNTALRYRLGNTEHSWHIAPSGTAGNPITFTQAMTLNASGNLGVGTTSFSAKLQVTTTTSDGTTPANIWNSAFLAVVPSGTSTGHGIGLSADTSTNTGYITAARPGVAWSSIGYRGLNHIFYAAGTSEAMRIDTSGNLIHSAPTTPPALTTNGQMVFNLTSDTNLRVSVRGSDGVTRTANITLA